MANGSKRKLAPRKRCNSSSKGANLVGQEGSATRQGLEKHRKRSKPLERGRTSYETVELEEEKGTSPKGLQNV